MSSLFYMENRGSMTRFDSLTPEKVTELSNGSLTYDSFRDALAANGLSAKYVFHDPSRHIEHTFYADYQNGIYGTILCLTREYFDSENGGNDLRRLSNLTVNGNSYLINKDWENFYALTVPVAMLIYDFQRRLHDIEPERVFSIWHKIYRRIDYANGMWDSATLEYVFSRAPESEKPEVGENGLLTIYRGKGELSQPPESAVSWSTHPGNALWFANHTARGTHMVMADVAPDDIVAWFPGFQNENEVIVRPGTVRNIRYENMLPAEQETFIRLSLPILPDFLRFGRQAEKLGYKEESVISFHGIKHILRVLFLSLVYFYNSGESLTDGDKSILIYFSLLHDVGRTNEYEDKYHGALSVEKTETQNLRIKGLQLTKKDCKIANLIIRYHSREDAEGLDAIGGYKGFSRKDKERAAQLYRICKDMDGLDRVRFNGLDYRFLRTEYARRLPLIAGCLLKEDLLGVCSKKEGDHEFL